MKQRWPATQGVSARVIAYCSAIESFNDMIMEHAFHFRLQNAVQHPSTAGTRRLANTLKPLLKPTSCHRGPFGPAERSATITCICAFVHCAGLPMRFWTISISPSKVEKLLALSIAGVQFPPIPSLQTRAQVIAHNPVAAARAFRKLINSVLTNLFLDC